VKTGDKMSAGTDSKVSLSVYGDKARLESVILDASVSTNKKKNPFERNSLDEFEIEGVDIGNVNYCFFWFAQLFSSF
jgi:hypothetical protein